MRSPNQLEVAEYLCWLSAVIGTLVAAVSSRIVFAGVPLSLSLLLNLINRRRLEVMLNHRAMTAVMQLQDQVGQEFDLLYNSIPESGRGSSVSSRGGSPQPLDLSARATDERLQAVAQQYHQLQGQYDRLHMTLAETIDYLNHSPLPQRLDGLETRLTQLSRELSQLRQQWQTTIPIEVPIQVTQESDGSESETSQTTVETSDPRPERSQGSASAVNLPFATHRDTPTRERLPSPTPAPVPTFSIEGRTGKREGTGTPSLPLQPGVSSPSPSGATIPSSAAGSSLRDERRDSAPSPTISPKIHRPERDKTQETSTDMAVGREVGLPQFQSRSGSEGLPQQVWDCLFTLDQCQDWVSDLLITPDGELLIAASFDRTIQVWHLKTGELVGALMDHESPVCSLALSQDGSLLASGSWDKTVKLWDLQGLREFRPTAKKPWDGMLFLGDTLVDETETAGSVRSLSMSPDSRFVASGWFEGDVQVWQVRVSPKRRRMTTTLCDRAQVNQGRVEAVCFTPDGRQLLTAGADGSIVVWGFETETGRFHRDRQLTEMPVPVNAIALAAQGTLLVSGSRDRTLQVWDLASGELQGVLEGHGGSVTTLAVCPDGDTVVSGSSDGTVKLWSLRQQGAIASFCDGSDAVMAVAVSPDGQAIVSGTADGTVKVWRRG
jgi:WD40 repeat protein